MAEDEIETVFMAMIECENLLKVYRNGEAETVALRGISFSVEKGEFVSIIGPSGSGKSTLMHILGALDSPTSGEYVLDGKEVSKLDDDALSDLRREKIGFVFQSFNLLPRATVLRNVMLPLLFTDVPREERERRARECLRYAGMEEEKFFHLSNQLSGGQMQRVAIARALINRPSMLLADEPTGNLDTKTGNEILQIFDEMHAAGHTIAIVTHDPRIAERCHRVIRIEDGAILSDALQKAA